MLDNIRYFIEDYWKVIISVVGVLVLVVGGILLFSGGSEEDTEGLITEDNYEQVEEEEGEGEDSEGTESTEGEDSEIEEDGGESEDNGETSETEEGTTGESTDSEELDNHEENLPEYNIEEEFTVSKETQDILDKRDGLNEKYNNLLAESGIGMEEQETLTDAYAIYINELNRDYECTEGIESDYESCLYSALGYAKSIASEPSYQKRFDDTIDNVLEGMFKQRAVIGEMERIYNEKTISNEVVDANVRNAIQMLYTSNSIQLEALDVAILEEDKLHEQSLDEDYTEFTDKVNEVNNDSVYITEEILGYLDSTIEQVKDYE